MKLINIIYANNYVTTGCIYSIVDLNIMPLYRFTSPRPNTRNPAAGVMKLLKIVKEIMQYHYMT